MDLLEIETLPEIAAYMDETAPIMRCVHCRWLFAPRSSPVSISRRTR